MYREIEQKLIQHLWKTGHFWTPHEPDVQNIRQMDLTKLTLQDSVVKQAVRSFQQADINLDIVSAGLHRRLITPDGDVGPATIMIADHPYRCPMPDHAPPPGAAFDYGIPELNEAVRSYQEAKTGTGSWPVGCDPNRPDVHSVVVAIDISNASAHQKGIMNDVLRYVEETEAEIGQAVRHVQDGSASRPQHDVKFQLIAGGVIGFAYFPQPNSCNQTVTARIDNSFNASLPVLAELLTHEYKGHSDGLEHSRGGIMNPSIGSPSKRASWISDPHETTKKRYFGGEPIPGPTPGPGPGPDPGPPILYPGLDPIVVTVGGKRYKYNPIPWPEV